LASDERLDKSTIAQLLLTALASDTYTPNADEPLGEAEKQARNHGTHAPIAFTLASALSFLLLERPPPAGRLAGDFSRGYARDVPRTSPPRWTRWLATSPPPTLRTTSRETKTTPPTATQT